MKTGNMSDNFEKSVFGVYKDLLSEGVPAVKAPAVMAREYGIPRQITEAIVTARYASAQKKVLAEATKPNVSKLYDKIFSIKEGLADAAQLALEVANDAETFGGEVARVLTGQIRQTLVPTIQKFIDDASNPASTTSLIAFLDNVPLAWVRNATDQHGVVPAYGEPGLCIRA